MHKPIYPPALLAHWCHHLAYAPPPFYLTDTLAGQMPARSLVLTRDEYAAMMTNRSFTDAYRGFAVDRAATHVALLAPVVMEQMSHSLRYELAQTQWQVGRGQLYSLPELVPILEGVLDDDALLARTIATADGALIALDATLWQSLDAARRTQLVAAFLRREREPYSFLARQVLEDVALLPHRRALLYSLASGYVADSGPNCFATALAATADTWEEAETVAALWLHTGPFERWLAAAGYSCCPGASAADTLLTDAVLVWRDADGDAQHACYVVGQGVCLNKNAQCWFAPRHLAATADVLALWADEPLTVEVYLHR